MEFQAGKMYVGRADNVLVTMYPANVTTGRVRGSALRKVWYVSAHIGDGDVVFGRPRGVDAVKEFLSKRCADFDSMRWERIDSELYDTAPWKKIATPEDRSLVYFVEGVGSGFVKIGSTKSLLSRVEALTPGCPYPLRVLHAEEGGRAQEIDYHHRFAEYHLLNEWFRYEGELRAFIESVASVN